MPSLFTQRPGRRAIWWLIGMLAAVAVCIGGAAVVTNRHPSSTKSSIESTASSGVRPSASNTGVPAGVSLTPSRSVTVTKAGTVLKDLSITGVVTIKARNVTILNSRITGRVDTGGPGQYPGTVIQHTEIVGPYSPKTDGGYPAVGYSDYTCNYCNVHGWQKGFDMVKNIVIANSWVHGVTHYGDPANGGSHSEALLSTGGSNFTIVNDNLDSGDAPNVTATLALLSQQAAITNVVASDNYFNGGGYCVYAGLSGSHGASKVSFTDNTFGTKYGPKCGGYGPATAFPNGPGNTWTGNVLEGGGAVGAPGSE